MIDGMACMQSLESRCLLSVAPAIDAAPPDTAPAGELRRVSVSIIGTYKGAYTSTTGHSHGSLVLVIASYDRGTGAVKGMLTASSGRHNRLVQFSIKGKYHAGDRSFKLTGSGP